MTTAEHHVMLEMIRADLELAYDHLNNDDEAMAEHELRNALEKISQIKQLKEASSTGLKTAATQQPLITLNPENGDNL